MPKRLLWRSFSKKQDLLSEGFPIIMPVVKCNIFIHVKEWEKVRKYGKDTPDKTLSCHVCQQKFKHSSNLQQHIQTQHGQDEWDKVKKKGRNSPDR